MSVKRLLSAHSMMRECAYCSGYHSRAASQRSVWKAITFSSILYSFGREVLSCGVVLALCGEVPS